MNTPRFRKKLTIWAGVLLVAGCGLAVVVAPAFAPTHGCGNRQLKDATQVRGLHMGMVTWAQQHPSTEPQVPDGER